MAPARATGEAGAGLALRLLATRRAPSLGLALVERPSARVTALSVCAALTSKQRMFPSHRDGC